jgi:hypothetical protein
MADRIPDFEIPFAESGDKTPIPKLAVPNSVSYEEGYPDEYSLPDSNPSHKNVPRATENQFKNDVTNGLQQIQREGILEYKENINYPVNAIVNTTIGILHIALVANGPLTANVTEPVGDLTGVWKVYSPIDISNIGGTTIVDGGMDIWPRGTNFAVGSTTTLVTSNFGVKTGITGGGVGNVSRQDFALGQTSVPGNPKHFMRFDLTTVAAGSPSEILNIVEDATLRAGEELTFNFYAKSAAPLNVDIVYYQYFGTGGAPSATVTAVVDTVAVTTSWQNFKVVFNVPSVNGMTLGDDGNDSFSVGLSVDPSEGVYTLDTNRWSTGNIGFPNFSRALVTANTERYYQKSYSPEIAPGTISNAGRRFMTWSHTGDFFQTQSFTCEMAVVPAITIYSPSSGAAGFISDSSGVEPDIAAVIIGASVSERSLSISFAPNSGADREYSYQYTADAGLIEQ